MTHPPLSPRRLHPLASLLLLPLLLLAACGDADETAKACAESDLIAQCPAGSNPVLGAAATESCSGMADGDLITQEGSVTGSCAASGECSVLCQFATPCDCGVKTITRDAIECNPCETTSCTPDTERCNGNAREICNQAGDRWESFACNEGATCMEDNGQTSCFDPDFTECTPNTTRCSGGGLETCNAEGNQVTFSACPGSQICITLNNTDTCVECTPGETFGCQPGNQSYGYCTPDGATDLMTCGPGNFFDTTCYDDHPLGLGCYECAPNDRLCGDDDNLYVCDNTGAFAQTTCPNGCVLAGPTGDRPECQ